MFLQSCRWKWKELSARNFWVIKKESSPWMFSESCNFLEVYASATNDSRMRTQRGKQHHYNKRKQIRYLTFLTLLSADAKSAIHLRVPSLTKVEVPNFPLIHFSRWFSLVNGQRAMSLRHVTKSVLCKFQCLCLLDIQQWSVYS